MLHRPDVHPSVTWSPAPPSGSIAEWGGQVFGVDLDGPFEKIAAGRFHSLGLKSDGSIVCWGDNRYGQCEVPSPNSGFIAVGAGGEHTVGLKGRAG